MNNTLTIHRDVHSLAVVIAAFKGNITLAASGRLSGICGFDGFIDTFVRLQTPASMAEFGPKVAAAAGITHESPYGTVVSRWRQKDGQIAYDVTVPPNSTARVILPKAKAEEVRESNRPLDKAAGVSSIRQDNGFASFDLAAGNYAFHWPVR